MQANEVFTGVLDAMSGQTLQRAMEAHERRMAQPATEPGFGFMKEQTAAEREYARAVAQQPRTDYLGRSL